MKKRYVFFIIILFILILSVARLFWMDLFQNSHEVEIQKGELDLSLWQDNDDEILLLDGEWEFYPQLLLMNEQSSESTNEKYKLVQIPSMWNSYIDEEHVNHPYGFGSYRLRLFVDSQNEENYSLYIPSIRSSSEVYVNGRLIAQSGKVDETANSYSAKNLPYTAVFSANEEGIVDIVIQVANFKDNRGGGIARSLKFGKESVITSERHVSILMQGITAIILFMHI